MNDAPQSLLQNVLRVHREPCIHYSDWRIHHLLTRNPAGYCRFIERELKECAAGRLSLELPAKLVFPDGECAGDFRVMPCVVRRPEGARKTIKLVGTNTVGRRVPDQVTVGKAWVLDPVENFVSHSFDACLLSSARTGACAAVAAARLAVSRARVNVVGAGRVGYYAALYLASLGNIDTVYLADRLDDRARRCADLLAQQVPAVRFTAVGFAELPECDVAVLATTSTRPLCAPPGWGAQLVASLGADTTYQRELDAAWLDMAEIYVDSTDSLRYGDLHAWRAAGCLREEQLTDLLQLLRSTPEPAGGRPRIFVSTGWALLDNLTIGYLLAQ